MQAPHASLDLGDLDVGPAAGARGGVGLKRLLGPSTISSPTPKFVTILCRCISLNVQQWQQPEQQYPRAQGVLLMSVRLLLQEERLMIGGVSTSATAVDATADTGGRGVL